MLLEITEGTPDLGVTSYWTDAEGNVVFGPNTPKEKMKTTVTGMKMQKRKESVTKTLPMEKVKDNEESKSKESEAQKDEEKAAVDAAAEPKASDSEQTGNAKEEVADQSEAPEQPAYTVEEPEPPAETQPETLSESNEEKY